MRSVPEMAERTHIRWKTKDLGAKVTVQRHELTVKTNAAQTSTQRRDIYSDGKTYIDERQTGHTRR